VIRGREEWKSERIKESSIMELEELEVVELKL